MFPFLVPVLHRLQEAEGKQVVQQVVTGSPWHPAGREPCVAEITPQERCPARHLRHKGGHRLSRDTLAVQPLNDASFQCSFSLLGSGRSFRNANQRLIVGGAIPLVSPVYVPA